MTYKDNIKAILECHFAGFKEEIIDSAVDRIIECETEQNLSMKKVSRLDKIRAEIEQTAKDYDKFDDYRRVRGLWIALEIIDKYKEK